MAAVQVRPLRISEWNSAMDLAWETFMEFEAPDYTPEGVTNFRNFVRDPKLRRLFLFGGYRAWGAFCDSEIIGMITVRNRSHISLLFVRKDMHHKGVATSLMQHLFAYERDELKLHEVTVNAAPYAIGFYHKVGFKDLGPEIQVDGIRYTPMKARV